MSTDEPKPEPELWNRGDRAWFVHDPKFGGQKHPVELLVDGAYRGDLVCVSTASGHDPEWLQDRYSSACGGYYVPIDRLFRTPEDAWLKWAKRD